MKNQINVTKTYLPPLEDFLEHMQDIWKEGWVTNYGNKVVNLENKLKKFLNINNLHLVANGTLALQFAIKSLNSPGEIITTPFSYIASTSSILWENYKPVFADIDPKTLCIDPKNIEKLITKNTKAILGVHVYGNPCDVESIQRIAKKYDLKVIYDAAHAFGVSYKDKSILRYGDISILSFHATKVFHSIEGGAVVAKDRKISGQISYMRHFSHKGPYNFHGLGINGKISEVHAAVGLMVLSKVKKIISLRKKASNLYTQQLKEYISRPVLREDTQYNYAYYPVIFKSESQLLRVERALRTKNIYLRRYFYPSINKIKYVIQKTGPSSCPVSEDISRRIVCLPLSHELDESQVNKISNIIIRAL